MATCIYLDHHATTPVDERVFNKMKPFFLSEFGNPASGTHGYGWRALEAVNEARKLVADAINAHPTEIIFTSGATESSNTAIKGQFLPGPHTDKREIITSSIEHPATLMSIRALAGLGVAGKYCKPDKNGEVQAATIKAAISENTALISLFFVNNEIGSINDIKAVTELAKKYTSLVHCDGAQALGRVPVDCKRLAIDMMSLSGHKIYGPKGVGVLYIRREIMEKISPLLHGGGHEWAMRSGTLNVAGIVGMGEAARLATLNLDEEVDRIRVLRDRLWTHLKALPDIFLNGSLENRVAGNLNISLAGIDGEELVLALCNRVALSTGSACSTGHTSHVLEEIGVEPHLRQSALRFGLGRSTTKEEIDLVSQWVLDEVRSLRKKHKKKLVKLVSRM